MALCFHVTGYNKFFILWDIVSQYNNAYWLQNVGYLQIIFPLNFTNCAVQFDKICHGRMGTLMISFVSCMELS